MIRQNQIKLHLLISDTLTLFFKKKPKNPQMSQWCTSELEGGKFRSTGMWTSLVAGRVGTGVWWNTRVRIISERWPWPHMAHLSFIAYYGRVAAAHVATGSSHVYRKPTCAKEREILAENSSWLCKVEVCGESWANSSLGASIWTHRYTTNKYVLQYELFYFIYLFLWDGRFQHFNSWRVKLFVYTWTIKWLIN